MHRAQPIRLSTFVVMAAAMLSAREAQGQRITPRPVRAVTLNPAAIVIQPVPVTALAVRARLTPLLSPAASVWVQSEAKVIAGQNLPPEALMSVAMNDVAVRFAGQKLSDADLVAISLVVVTQAVEAADADLKAATPPGSLSDMSEAQQLRMQAAMDRRSKLFSTLSNLLKKSSETASSITANIK
jgi:hypothetical protein